MLTADAFGFDRGVGLGAVRTDFRLVPRRSKSGGRASHHATQMLYRPCYTNPGARPIIPHSSPTYEYDPLAMQMSQPQTPTRPDLMVVLMAVSIPAMARVGE
jgi:hypothetical protein